MLVGNQPFLTYQFLWFVHPLTYQKEYKKGYRRSSQSSTEPSVWSVSTSSLDMSRDGGKYWGHSDLCLLLVSCFYFSDVWPILLFPVFIFFVSCRHLASLCFPCWLFLFWRGLWSFLRAERQLDNIGNGGRRCYLERTWGLSAALSHGLAEGKDWVSSLFAFNSPKGFFHQWLTVSKSWTCSGRLFKKLIIHLKHKQFEVFTYPKALSLLVYLQLVKICLDAADPQCLKTTLPHMWSIPLFPVILDLLPGVQYSAEAGSNSDWWAKTQTVQCESANLRVNPASTQALPYLH